MERLKEAIEKARAQRGSDSTEVPVGTAPSSQSTLILGGAQRSAAPRPVPQEHFAWTRLEALELAPGRLRGKRVISRERTDAASISFDVLRARVLKAFRDNGWKRLAITSPTKGCGKTFCSVNLAMSVARQPELKTLLVDMDLRRPNVSTTLSQNEQWKIRTWLDGNTSMERHLRRVGDNLALSLNAEPIRDAAEIILSSRTAEVLQEAIDVLEPDLVIYDLPPALVNDDVYNFLPNVDAVLLVAAAGLTTPDHIESCEQLFENNCAFLGVLLNMVQDGGEESYGYGY